MQIAFAIFAFREIKRALQLYVVTCELCTSIQLLLVLRRSTVLCVQSVVASSAQ